MFRILQKVIRNAKGKFRGYISMITFFSKKLYFLALIGILLLFGMESSVIAIPKVSEDADYTITLQSSEEKTSFYVDGKFVGVAEDGDLQVLINRTKGHSITAEAPGYNKLSPHGIPPNFNYKAINDTVKLSFLYSDNKDYEVPKVAGVVINGGNIYGPVGGGTINHQTINNDGRTTESTDSEGVSVSQSNSGDLKTVTESIINVCKNPSEPGKYWDIKIEGNGDAKVRLKPNIEGGITATFNRQEWSGVQRVLQKDELVKQKMHYECVEKLTPIFLDKFVSSSPSSLIQEFNHIPKKNV